MTQALILSRDMPVNLCASDITSFFETRILSSSIVFEVHQNIPCRRISSSQWCSFKQLKHDILEKRRLRFDLILLYKLIYEFRYFAVFKFDSLHRLFLMHDIMVQSLPLRNLIAAVVVNFILIELPEYGLIYLVLLWQHSI